MADWTIYHNPRCSRSRAALEFLQQRGIDPKIVLYLKTPPDRAMLEKLVKWSGNRPADFVRQNEKLFRELKLDLDDDQAVLDALAEHPSLLQRPIVVHRQRAVIARPADRILDLAS